MVGNSAGDDRLEALQRWQRHTSVDSGIAKLKWMPLEFLKITQTYVNEQRQHARGVFNEGMA